MFVANNINIDTRNKFNHGPLALALATVTRITSTTSAAMSPSRFEIIFALHSLQVVQSTRLDLTRSVCLPPQTFNVFIFFTTAVLCAQQHPLSSFLSFSTNYYNASLFNKKEWEYPSKSTFVLVEHWNNIHHPVPGSLHCHSGNFSTSTLPSSSSHPFDTQPLNPNAILTHLLARGDYLFARSLLLFRLVLLFVVNAVEMLQCM